MIRTDVVVTLRAVARGFCGCVLMMKQHSARVVILADSHTHTVLGFEQVLLELQLELLQLELLLLLLLLHELLLVLLLLPVPVVFVHLLVHKHVPLFVLAHVRKVVLASLFLFRLRDLVCSKRCT